MTAFSSQPSSFLFLLPLVVVVVVEILDAVMVAASVAGAFDPGESEGEGVLLIESER